MFDDTEPFPRRRGHHAENHLDARPARSTPVLTSDDVRSPAVPAVGRGRTRRKLRLTVGQLAAVRAAQQAADGHLPARDEAAGNRLRYRLSAGHAHSATAVKREPSALALGKATSSTVESSPATSHSKHSNHGTNSVEAKASDSMPERKRTTPRNTLAGQAKREGVSRAEGADGGTRAAGRKKGDHRVKRQDGMPETPAWLSNMKSVARK